MRAGPRSQAGLPCGGRREPRRGSTGTQAGLLDPHHRLDRGGVRRHRHQPALRPARGPGPRPRRRGGLGDPGGLLPGDLGADPGGDGQVPDPRHARRQPRRRRHPGPDGAGPARARQTLYHGAGPRGRRRGHVLRRQPDHPGHLGALGRRGPDRRPRRPSVRALCAADRGRDPDRPVRGPGARHGDRGPLVRPDHARLVHRACGAGDPLDRRDARSALGAESAVWREDAVQRGPAGPGDPRQRLPGGHGGGGALRRHGAFRKGADPGGLAGG
jgi:hypothetical protein